MSRLPFLAANPDLFQEMIETNFVIGRSGSAAVRRVRERTSQRMARTMLRRVEVQMAVSKLDAAVGLARDVRVVRHHQDGVAGVVQFAENLEDHCFVGLVEISGGLVGENDLRLIDQRARNGHSLLLAAGELRGEMRQAVAESHTLQRFLGLLFVRDAMEILRKHHIFKSREIRHEMKLLEDEADLFRAVTHQLVFAEFRKIDAVNYHMAGGESVQAAENVDQGSFPRAGGAHERDPFAGVHIEADAAERAQCAVLLDQIFDDHLLRRG